MDSSPLTGERVVNNAHPAFRPLARHTRLALLAAGLLAAQIGFAAQTEISEVPPESKITVPANVMFTLDDSGSMYWESIPDSHGFRDGIYLFPRPANVYDWRTGATDYPANPVSTDLDDPNARFYRSYAGNPLYYNPEKTYKPWSNSDGSLWPNAEPTRAWLNPGHPNRDDYTLDLTQNLLWRPPPDSSNVAEATIYPATYFVYTGPAPLVRTDTTTTNTPGNFARVQIGLTTLPPRSPKRTDCAGDPCTYAEEIKNFANWFSYHRSRHLAARAAIGKAFSEQKDNLRVGYATINRTTETDIDGFTTKRVVRGLRLFKDEEAADKRWRTQFFDWLYKDPMPRFLTTPLRTAMDDVGNYFTSAPPWRAKVEDSTSAALSCQRSHHILMTDGYYDNTGDSARTSISGSNIDNLEGDEHTSEDGTRSYSYLPAAPYKDDYTNTLADVAMYYWKTDLRPGLANGIPDDDRNPAFWQHLSTYTIGFGITGMLSESDIVALFAGRLNSVSWLNPTTGGNTDRAKGDDLVHAALNGRGEFFRADDPELFAQRMSKVLESLANNPSGAAAAAVTKPYIDIANNFTYETSYRAAQRMGDIKAYKLHLETGQPDRNQPAWTKPCPTDASRTCAKGVAEMLEARTADSRQIATFNGSSGVDFTSSGLGTTLLGQLQSPAGAGNGAQVLAYLRGDRSQESTSLRRRLQVLGPIIHSEPVLVREPDRSYADAGYASFRSSTTGRTRMLYVGANDGMMHAFDASTGAEKWAYVPKAVFPRLPGLASPNGLFEATVDGYLTEGDVDFGFTGGTRGTADWRTLLVGGLGRGGKGFYALDITSPEVTESSPLTAKVLWEFSGDADLGLAFSRPIIVKHEVVTTDNRGNETRSGQGWVVLVSSGYNNTSGDGRGYLYVLNAKTGALIKKLSTGVGSASDPSGLGQLGAWVHNADVNNSVQWVYGGDLKGNLWRFDLSAANPDAWSTSKLAVLTDATGNAQPITAAPELTRVKAGNDFRNLVVVGTGRYLGEKDVPGTTVSAADAAQVQTFYVIEDRIDRGGSTVVRADLTPRTLAAETDGTRTLSDAADINWSAKRGWRVDLNISGERATTDPAIAHTTVAFTTNVPSASDPCVPGGTSYLFQFDLATGMAPIGTNALPYVGKRLRPGLASRVVLIVTPNGQVIGLIRKTDDSSEAEPIVTSVSGGDIRRISWRELNYR